MKIQNKERNIMRSRWRAMKQRCYNPSNDNYKYYGGKGIKICEEWHDFENYSKWCYSHGYVFGVCDSIERIDNNADYSPQNCIIISRNNQQKHKSNNHYITYNGKTQILSEWAKEYNIPSWLLQQRINRDGLPMNIALNKNYDGRKHNREDFEEEEFEEEFNYNDEDEDIDWKFEYELLKGDDAYTERAAQEVIEKFANA